MSRTAIPQRTIKVLFARPMNWCAFPDCATTNVDSKKDVVNRKGVFLCDIIMKVVKSEADM